MARSIMRRLDSLMATGNVEQAKRLISQRADVEAQVEERSVCAHCNSSEGLELYMVTDETWTAGGMGPGRSGMLHLRCLEARLGRHLADADFITCAVNSTLLFGLSRR